MRATRRPNTACSRRRRRDREAPRLKPGVGRGVRSSLDQLGLGRRQGRARYAAGSCNGTALSRLAHLPLRAQAPSNGCRAVTAVSGHVEHRRPRLYTAARVPVIGCRVEPTSCQAKGAQSISVEGEWSSTGMMSAREPSRYGMTFNEERREWCFGANVRFHSRPGRSVDVEPVVGLAILRNRGWSQVEYYRYWLMPQQVLEIGTREPYARRTSFGITGGVDLRLGGRHVAPCPRSGFMGWPGAVPI